MHEAILGFVVGAVMAASLQLLIWAFFPEPPEAADDVQKALSRLDKPKHQPEARENCLCTTKERKIRRKRK